MKKGKEMDVQMYTLHLLACETIYQRKGYIVLMESILNWFTVTTAGLLR